MEWNYEFPETNNIALTIDSIKLAKTAECIKVIIAEELRLPDEKRNLLPGLRDAINIIRNVDVENR